jgi:uncharacterized membrane protein YeaQ/YmgE (transglycosylase-associated protein family)
MSATEILWYLIIGLITGWVAGRVIRGGGLGLTGNLVLGLTGALIGGYLFTAPNFMNHLGIPGAILAATLGSGITLGILSWLKSLLPQSETSLPEK